ncbi:hypothetical protein TKK_0018743 [Trichogramma kaykai]|uniref:Small RNA 2'-O-methyltransferase n=1 Tax=Trichogramma kaykai TaxID=54128 RepID=A0ABD2VY07_9HYME
MSDEANDAHNYQEIPAPMYEHLVQLHSESDDNEEHDDAISAPSTESSLSDDAFEESIQKRIRDFKLFNPSPPPSPVLDLTNYKHKYTRQWSLPESPRQSSSMSRIQFHPPAYVQRYEAVRDVLEKDPRWASNLKSVIDYGCNDMAFFKYLKQIPGVEEIYCIDVDPDTLKARYRNVQPFHVDYLIQRESPLKVQVLLGSVVDPDSIVKDCDAVVAIELIEHLYPEELEKFPANVFGFIKPKVAVITTPNVEFNVVFTDLVGFRHPDHKFEWTRAEFQKWATDIVTKYPDYEVSFHDVCLGPEETRNLGGCTQMAVFHKHSDLQTERVPGQEGLLIPVILYNYPYHNDKRCVKQKIHDDAVFHIHNKGPPEVPLDYIHDKVKDYEISLMELKEFLESYHWTIVRKEDGYVIKVPEYNVFSTENDAEDYKTDEECAVRTENELSPSDPIIENWDSD